MNACRAIRGPLLPPSEPHSAVPHRHAGDRRFEGGLHEDFSNLIAFKMIDPHFGIFTEICGGGYARPAIALIRDPPRGASRPGSKAFPAAAAGWQPRTA